jgi:hypothetical protein
MRTTRSHETLPRLLTPAAAAVLVVGLTLVPTVSHAPAPHTRVGAMMCPLAAARLTTYVHPLTSSIKPPTPRPRTCPGPNL